jgi:Na+-transporting methylmalonyl-CoA/oxaloacetate decarboxylase gamma subunit
MINALWITLIGMGLVFIAILLLWGMMSLLVWIAARLEPETAPETDIPGPADAGGAAEAAVAGDAEPQNRKRRAAAAAVSVAIALSRQKSRTQPAAPAGEAPEISAWQVVNRAQQMNRQNRLTREKRTR